MERILTLKQEARQKLKELTEYVDQYKHIVDLLMDDEYSKVPMSIKMELRNIEKKIRECL